MGRRAHGLAVLLGAVALVAALSFALVRIVVPRPPPAELPVPAPLGPALTRHLLLVIVDGLRYDFATDPERMPDLARRMREHTSAEIWSSPVSMTSSAILTYATGQRGDIDQIVNNESGSAVAHNDLVHNARAAGLVTACTGDRAWMKYFPGAWTLEHPDPAGVGIEVDYNAEIFDAASAFLRGEGAPARPALMVAHFVTPDHQAHAWGVLSDRYRAHLRAFDQSLTALLAAVPADTTVIVTSDHGATDTGTHGSDTPVQRRSPILAYGPGIARGRHDAKALDQIDLPDTFAALLGVSPPAHGRGHVLVDWLDLEDDERADLACRSLGRLTRYARTAVDESALARSGAAEACAPAAPRDRIERAARAARALDVSLDGAVLGASRAGWLVPALAIAGALAIGLGALGRRGLAQRAPVRVSQSAYGGVLLGGVALGASVFLTHRLELLPGSWPNAVRVLLYVVANALLLLGLVRPRSALAWLDRHPAAGAALAPGLLAVTPTKTTQPEAFALSVIIAGFALTVGFPRGRTPGAPTAPPFGPRASARARLAASAPRLALVATLLLALAPVGVLEHGYVPAALMSSPGALLAVACAAIILFALERHLAGAGAGGGSGRRGPLLLATGAAVAIGSLLLRRSAPAPVCLAGWLGLGALALVAWSRRERALAELFALASYAWVSRDAEIPILIASYLVADAVGAGFAADIRRRREDGETESSIRPALVLLLVTFVFAWTYVQRIGIQLGIDFVHLDWGAGAFRERGVSLFRIGAALSFKHCLARGAVLFAVMAPLPREHRIWAARGLLATELFRVAALITTLHVCRGSFWTAFRVIGDAPHALAAVVVAAIAVAAASAARGREGRASVAPAELDEPPRLSGAA